MTTVAQHIHNLRKHYDPNEHIAVAIWQVADIASRAEDRGIPVTADQAEVIVQCMDENHDACTGLDWYVVDCYLDELPVPEGSWSWMDAFDKFGFNDGDGHVMTDEVIAALEKIGCTATSEQWGMHNRVITSIITADGDEAMPIKNANVTIGYDCPRTYLPRPMIDYLDATCPWETEEDNT